MQYIFLIIFNLLVVFVDKKKREAERKELIRKEYILDNGPSYKQQLFKIVF
jgi:hypothetical protein